MMPSRPTRSTRPGAAPPEPAEFRRGLNGRGDRNDPATRKSNDLQQIAPQALTVPRRLRKRTAVAQVAELVDAPASGAGARKGVEVRVLSWAPLFFLSRTKRYGFVRAYRASALTQRFPHGPCDAPSLRYQVGILIPQRSGSERAARGRARPACDPADRWRTDQRHHLRLGPCQVAQQKRAVTNAVCPIRLTGWCWPWPPARTIPAWAGDRDGERPRG
jgi:hypothetical protein